MNRVCDLRNLCRALMNCFLIIIISKIRSKCFLTGDNVALQIGFFFSYTSSSISSDIHWYLGFLQALRKMLAAVWYHFACVFTYSSCPVHLSLRYFLPVIVAYFGCMSSTFSLLLRFLLDGFLSLASFSSWLLTSSWSWSINQWIEIYTVPLRALKRFAHRMFCSLSNLSSSFYLLL